MAQPIIKATASAPQGISPNSIGREVPAIAAIGSAEIEWKESPARLLHDRLVATFVARSMERRNESLSPRTKLAIVVGSSAVLWLAIGLVFAALA